MSLESKRRMISFRLTAEEYDRCCQLCFDQGLGSVSELARAAIHLLLRQPRRTSTAAAAIEERVRDLESQLHLLMMELQRLRKSAPQTSVHHGAV